MKKRLLFSAAAIVAGLAFSGCATWFLAGANLSKVRLKPDKKTVLTVGTHPMAIKSDEIRSRPFFLLALPDDGALAPANPRRFDVKGAFTRRGLPLTPNTELRDYLFQGDVTGDECGTIPLDDENTTYRVFSTSRRVNDKRKPQLKAVSKLGIRQRSLADSPFSQVGIAVGSADLDGDGDYSDSVCTGGAALALYTKSGAPRASREQLRSLNDAINNE